MRIGTSVLLKSTLISPNGEERWDEIKYVGRDPDDITNRHHFISFDGLTKLWVISIENIINNGNMKPLDGIRPIKHLRTLDDIQGNDCFTELLPF